MRKTSEACAGSKGSMTCDDPENKPSTSPHKNKETAGKGASQVQSRKRTASKVERALDDVVTKFVAAQSSSENKFYELEEKQLKQEMVLEENRMKLENERRKQELEHEMRLMVMMTQMFSRSYGNGSYGTPPMTPTQSPPEWGTSSYHPTRPFTSTMPPYQNRDSYSQDM